jgi:hypothetical protein
MLGRHSKTLNDVTSFIPSDATTLSLDHEICHLQLSEMEK